MNSDNRDEPLWAQFPPSFLGANNFCLRPFRTDKTRWMEAFKPPAAEQEGETVYASWGKDSVMNWILNILWEEYTYNIACITGASWAKRGEWALRVKRNTGVKNENEQKKQDWFYSREYIFFVTKISKARHGLPSSGSYMIVCKTLKNESRAFLNIGNKKIYTPDCNNSIASFVLYFNF